MIPKVFPRMLRIGCHPRDRVELVISHDTLGGTRIHHRSNQLDRCQLLRAAINQIPYEDCRSILMAPSAGRLAISQIPQQSNKLVELAVHIADDVKSARQTGASRRRPERNPSNESAANSTSIPHDS
jgi:hypothetical protein